MTKDLDSITVLNSRGDRHSKDYKYKLFYMWYEFGCPSGADFYEAIAPEDRYDELTGNTLTKNWITNQIANWRPDAYELDRQVVDRLKEKAISDRVELLQRQIPEFQELQEMALKHLREKGMGSSRNAITAYFKAAEQERLARNVPIEEYEDISSLTEAQVVDLITRLSEEGTLEDTKGSLPAKGATQ